VRAQALSVAWQLMAGCLRLGRRLQSGAGCQCQCPTVRVNLKRSMSHRSQVPHNSLLVASQIGPGSGQLRTLPETPIGTPQAGGNDIKRSSTHSHITRYNIKFASSGRKRRSMTLSNTMETMAAPRISPGSSWWFPAMTRITRWVVAQKRRKSLRCILSKLSQWLLHLRVRAVISCAFIRSIAVNSVDYRNGKLRLPSRTVVLGGCRRRRGRSRGLRSRGAYVFHASARTTGNW
jgi:hypothetical protein